MFNNNDSIAIAIDPTTRPFWTTGDAITGNVNLQVDNKLSFTSIFISLICEEAGIVATYHDEREVEHEKKPIRPWRVVKRTMLHCNTHQTVAGSESNGPSENIVLESGGYEFPFTVELMDDINNCPPHAPIHTRGGLNLGVKWYLEVTARRNGALQNNLKATHIVPVFPNSPQALTSSNLDKDLSASSDLNGHETASANSRNTRGYFMIKNVDTKLDANLKYPSIGMPQGPKTPKFELSLRSTGEDAHVHSVSLLLVRTCSCLVRSYNDTYITAHPLGTANVDRVVSSDPIDLSHLLENFKLSEAMAYSFQTQLMSVKYTLMLRVEYSENSSGQKQNHDLTTPIEVIPPYLCWTESNSVIEGRRRESFNSTSKSATQRPRRPSKTGSIGHSFMQNGTMSTYEIKRPFNVVTDWVTNLK